MAAGRNPRKTVRKQATKDSRPERAEDRFLCPTCAAPARLTGDRLACPSGHQTEATSGYFDLGPAGAATADLYSGPFGWMYDTGVNLRPLARLTARLEWGADVGRMYRWMAEALPAAGELVLDVPCGGGTSFAEGPRVAGRLVGVDLSRGMLARAARRRAARHLEDRVTLILADAGALPLAGGGADRILCFNGLHVIPDKAAALAEMRRVLRPGGELVGTCLVTDAPAPFSALVALERRARFFVPPSSARLAGLAATAGFSSWQADREGALLFFRGQ